MNSAGLFPPATGMKAMTLQPGEMIDGKYRIVRLLGQGGMGAVYEGENARIHRKVAIKILHGAVAAKADVVQRFEREAQAAGRIGSEHIVEVLDLGAVGDGERYMVMEFLDGESLGDRIKRRKQLKPHEIAPIVHQLLEGLTSAHEAGIVHRDLKPDNVYLITRKSQRDFVKILDFGVSKFNALDSDMSMTKTGAVMGTPYYMSPEQARGAKVDHRSDLYSVGVVLYQAVTGRLPFRAETFNELVFKIALETAEPPEALVPDLEPGFAAIIVKAMARDVEHRFQSAREFQSAVAQWMMTSAPSDLLLGTSNPGLAPPPTPSHPGLSASAASLSTSGAGLSTSGARPSAGPPSLSGSQTGTALAMTTPQPRRSGLYAVVALGLLLGAGGVAAYKIAGAGGGTASAAGPGPATQAQGAPGEAAKAAEPAKVEEPAKPEAAAKVEEPTRAAEPQPEAAAPPATATAAATTTAAATAPARPGARYTPPGPRPTTKTTPTGAKPQGRTVSTDL